MKIVLTLLFLAFCLFEGQCSDKEPVILGKKYFSTPKLSCAEIKFIVDYHNYCRKKVITGSLENQPKGSNIQKLVWDTELAEIASNYTKKMIFAHNNDRQSARFAVGENLFMTASSNTRNKTLEWKRPIDAWFDEYAIYTYQPAVDDPPTAHYTQVVWADTIYVGCGATLFTDSRNWLYKYYVCNYGPTGNWYGTFPYEEDSGVNELAVLVELGILPPDTEIPEPVNDLLCDMGQCDTLYGPTCSK